MDDSQVRLIEVSQGLHLKLRCFADFQLVVVVPFILFGCLLVDALHMTREALADENEGEKSLGTVIDNEQPEAIWQAVLNVPATVDSRRGVYGSFEIQHLSISSSKERQLKRFFVESNESGNYLLVRDDGSFPLALGRTGEFYTVNEGGKWSLRELDFFIDVDGANFPSFVRIKPPNKQFCTVLDFGSILRKLYSDQVVSIHWDRDRLTLTASKSSGAKCEIRFRSPLGQSRHGCELAEVTLYDRDLKSALRVVGMSRHSSFLSRLNWEDLRSFVGPVAKTREEFSDDLNYSTASSPTEIRACVKFWEIASGIQEPNLRGLVLDDQSYQKLSDRQKLTALVLMSQGNLLTQGQITEIASQLLRLSYQNETAVDEHDPVIRWFNQEQRFSPAVWLQAYFAATKLVSDERILIKSRSELLRFLANSGRPPFDLNGNVAVELFADDPVAVAFLRANWGMPCDDSLINDVKDNFRIHKKTSESALLAVETLVRLNLVEIIPQEFIDEWYSRRNSNSASLTEIRNQRSLLSLVPSGRRFLMKRLHKSQPRTDDEVEITTVLGQLIEAVKRTERYDFISKEEIQYIEEVISSKVYSK